MITNSIHLKMGVIESWSSWQLPFGSKCEMPSPSFLKIPLGSPRRTRFSGHQSHSHVAGVWGSDMFEAGKQLLAGAKEESLTVAGIFRGHHAEFPKRVEDGGSEFRHWWHKPRNSQIPTIWAAHWRNIAVLWDTTPKLWKPSKLHDKDSAIPIVRSFLKWIGSLSELYR